MRFNFSGKQDVYIEIAERYREYIELGVIKCGEKLPSVREAAEELGVNPNTIARAYNLLEEKGYISMGDNANRMIRLVGAEFGKTAQIPLLGTVTAGQPILAFEEVTDYIPFAAGGEDAKKLFAVMGLGAKKGSVLTVTAVGEDENDAVLQMEEAMRNAGL